MWNTNWIKLCSVNGCNKEVDSKGFCRTHYSRFWRNGTTNKLNGDKRNHPLYNIWWQRKQNGYLCEAWLDFEIFIKAVSPKPEGNYFLVRLRNELFGPDNFKWQEHLKRKEGESKKDWWDRKRKARIAANPSMESDRNLKRTFNMSRQEYDDKLKVQNFVCAICEKPEIAVNANTGTLKRLAVDHNHKTGVIRDLLCWRCNSTIGKINEDLDLLEKIKQYLTKHQELN